MSCILTLAMDDSAQKRFENVRQEWFPKERNLIPAHLTLFHVLPESEQTFEELRFASAMTAQFAVHVVQVRSLGRGVAYGLESEELQELHSKLSAKFQDSLSPQDKQKFFPHVVAQNKVSADVAKETLAVLKSKFAPWSFNAVGVDLWRYLGGPWLLLNRFEFSDVPSNTH